MKTVLFFVESISFGHLTRMLCLAETLRLLSDQIIFCCGESHTKIIQTKGFEAINIQLVNPRLIYERAINFQEMYSAEELENYFQQDLKLLQRVKPDLIVYDMRLSIPILAKILDIPCISVVNGIWTKYFSEKRSAPFHLRKKILVDQFILDRLYSYCEGGFVESMMQRNFIKGLDTLYFSHGLDPLNSFAEYVSAGDICFVADLPEIVPIENAPNNVHYIGPAIWNPPPDVFKTKNIIVSEDRPSIYFSLGSSVFANQLVGPCVRKLLKAGFHIILQIGNRLIKDLPIDEELQVVDYAQNQEILPQVSLLISHGGVATSYESIKAKTPFIGIPSFVDQQWNMDCFVKAKVARSINPDLLSPNQLLSHVEEILDQEDIYLRLTKLSDAINDFPFEEVVLSNAKALLDQHQPKPERIRNYFPELR